MSAAAAPRIDNWYPDASYIVVFKEDTPDDVIQEEMKKVENEGGKIKHVYTTAIKGFSATMPDSLMHSFKTNESLKYIEADGEVKAY